MLASGFTIVRDMGNNANYADTALRQAIEQGWIPGPTIINWVMGKTRGELCLEFLRTWKDAGIPNADTLRALTINGYKVSETETTRGPIKAGFFGT